MKIINALLSVKIQRSKLVKIILTTAKIKLLIGRSSNELIFVEKKSHETKELKFQLHKNELFVHTCRGEGEQFLRLNNEINFERFCYKKKSNKSKIGTSFVNVITVTTHTTIFT